MKKIALLASLAVLAWGVVAAEPAAKLKDDGTCWAVTEAGTRCKHKKDGASDYCKQHGPNVKAKTPPTQCRALKWDGERCGRKPEEGFLYCAQHRKLGANQPAAKDPAPAKAKPATKAKLPAKAK